MGIDESKLNADKPPVAPQYWQGHCYCGSVKYRIRQGTEPIITGYCHCESCRRAHSAPLYQVVYIPRNDYEIIEGSQYCKVAKRPRRKKEKEEEKEEEVSAKPGIDGNEDEDGDNDRNKRQQKEENDRNLPEEPLILYVGFFPSTLDLELQYGPLRPVSFNPSANFHSEETVLDLDKLLDGIERK